MGNVLKKSSLRDDLQEFLNSAYLNGLENQRLDMSLKDRGIDDDMIEELCEWLVKLEGKIKVLELMGNKITSKGASILLEALNKNKSTIEEINLDENKLGDECMESLGNYIKQNQYIQSVSLSNYFPYADNNITDKGIEILSNYLIGNKTFKTLGLNNNKGITDKSAPHLIRMIKSSNIIHVDVSDTSITEHNIFILPLFENLLNFGCKYITLSCKPLLDDDLIGICEVMEKQNCEKLEEINLNRNLITSKSATQLFDTLKQIKSKINKLDIEANQLDDKCISSLGEYICNNDSIKDINLRSNNITDKGIEILSDYLIGNITMKRLDIAVNRGITDKSFPYLVDIAKKSSLISLILFDTAISFKETVNLQEYLKVPTDQREIPIKSSAKSASKISN